MAEVVLAKQQSVNIEILTDLFQFTFQKALLKQLLLQAERDRHAKRAETSGRERNIGFQQSFKFQERLVVEHDLVKLVQLCVNFLQAIGDSIGRKRRIVLLTGETLLLRSGQNMTVLNQRGCAVMVKSRNSENTHRR